MAAGFDFVLQITILPNIELDEVPIRQENTVYSSLCI